jgi:hypothetical protein
LEDGLNASCSSSSCRVAPEVSPRRPHGPVRAAFPHTVLPVMAALNRGRGAIVTCISHRVSVYHSLFPNNAPSPGRLPSLLPGSGGFRSPAFDRYYEAATTAYLLSRPFLCGVGPRYLGLPQGRCRLSQVPREPLCASALLSDPGRASVPSLRGTSVLPPSGRQGGPQQPDYFRGSITELQHSLFTLRAALTSDYAKLASGGGQPFRVGVYYPLSSVGRFRPCGPLRP